MTDDTSKTPPQNQPMNLDLIAMVQRARIAHDSEVKPSEAAANYWLEAKSRDEHSVPTPRAGQWVVHTDLDHVDSVWEQIKAATEAGQLGYKSKVSTVPRPHAGNARARMIYVKTVDGDDNADAERVRAALSGMGIEVAGYLRGDA